MIRHLAGLEPERLSKTVLRFHRGSVASIDGSQVYDFPLAYDVDTAAQGAGGMAYCGFNNGVDYFPYVIRNTVTGELGITLSDQISTSLVQLPSTDWEVVRKLPWGFVGINGIYLEGGVSGVPEIPTFHISNWPKPTTHLTQATTESNFNRVAANASSSSWSSFSVAKVVPDNARFVHLLCNITGSGWVYLRAGAFAGNGIKCGPGQFVLPIRCNSNMEIEYVRTGSAVLNAFVMAYDNTEPS